MTLSDYLKLEGKTASAFAHDAGVAVSTITRAVNGKLIPSRDLMKVIFEITDGAVTANDFFNLPQSSEAA